MIINDLWNLLEKKVFSIRSTNILFNQYRDKDLSVDLPNADKIRRGNLMSYLKCFSKRPSIVIVGEAPGPWGCRFSGVPFTSEAQLCNGILPFVGCQSSVRDSPYMEKTATIFWNIMLPYHPKFFIWNCIPFHPHNNSEILSIRNPTRDEVSMYSKLLSEILSLFKSQHVIAVGRKAELALNQTGVSCTYVHHPSRGRTNDFIRDIKGIFNEL